MSNPYFQFKQFTIRHDRCAMKVGTDGVLLGAWSMNGTHAPSSPSLKVLDIGTGTGLIALMLAQRFPHATIEGIDIDDEAIAQAKENVQESAFAKQINISKNDFTNITQYSNKYNLIVSNPPFYKENTLGRNAARNKARHTSSLSFETLISNASKLLENNGVFCVIIPHSHATEFISLCIENHLYLQRRMDVQSVATKDFNRSMLEFTTSMKNTEHQTLLLYDSEHNRTPEYTRLTTEFYL